MGQVEHFKARGEAAKLDILFQINAQVINFAGGCLTTAQINHRSFHGFRTSSASPPEAIKPFHVKAEKGTGAAHQTVGPAPTTPTSGRWKPKLSRRHSQQFRLLLLSRLQ